MKNILPGYTAPELETIIFAYAQEALASAELHDVIVLKGIKLYGSRTRDDFTPDSDLDVLIEYTGEVKEYVLFDILNDAENALLVSGIPIDINPIRAEESGTIQTYYPKVSSFRKRPPQTSKEVSHMKNDIKAESLIDAFNRWTTLEDQSNAETTWVCVYKDVLNYEDEDNLTYILVPTDWLKEALIKEGETDFESWFNEYTADSTVDIGMNAMREGVVLDCEDKAIPLPTPKKSFDKLLADANAKKETNAHLYKPSEKDFEH